MEANEILFWFTNYKMKDDKDYTDLRGVMTGLLNKACGGDDNRHLVLKFLTGKTSVKELTVQELAGLYWLVQPEKPEGGKWRPANGEELLRMLCGKILAAVVDQPGQTKMELG